jgi:phospholipid-translocating ATPase
MHLVDPMGTHRSCLIAFQNIVPISLYISIEIVKTIQAYFISQDVDMFYAPYDTACVPKTWNISDDLGQIEYIFSDKTGTLTQNIMEFQRCSVNGVPYGEGVTEAQRGSAIRTGGGDPSTGSLPSKEEQIEMLDTLKRDMLSKMNNAFNNRWAQPAKLTLISPQLASNLSDPSSPQYPHLLAFFRSLAICHSVLPDRPDPQLSPFEVNYKAESPDEAALVAAARDVGFPFVSKSNAGIDIEVLGRPERYIPLRMLEFNSTRKRMSVIVRTPENRIILYCKGADSVVYARLSTDQDEGIKEKTQRDMETFANGGLRTLCVAYRELSEQAYEEWSREYDAATTALTDRDEAIERACDKIECELHILGATALEDKLQEGVPDAIEMLHRAGIKLWILTGDKVQTAIEIGYSCNLLKQDMDVLILSATTKAEARAKIEAGLNKLATVLGPPSFEAIKRKEGRGFVPGEKRGFAVVVDGDTLRYALEADLKPLFLNLATQCETVVCCRVSPAQKALTVKLVKEGRNAMTLSIGDGANDVAMIQEANVGCGLLGLEGSQAAMSADYAFGQFRFLTKLLIVHGRWSYLRIANMHANFFYKNVIWTFAMFWYLFYNR